MGVGAALLLVSAGAAPAWVTSGELEPQELVRAQASAAWTANEALFHSLASFTPKPATQPIVIKKGSGLKRGTGGSSTLGVIELRQDKPFSVNERELVLLKHEVAHQFLFATCPAAARDRLFHEAYAMAVSGELNTWADDDYSGLIASVSTLSSSANALDSPKARKALARLLVESIKPGLSFPTTLVGFVKRCADGATWSPLTPEALVDTTRDQPVFAFVVLNRFSGEVLVREGDVEAALPYGSTLKPFVVAGAAGAGPTLPNTHSPEWLCGNAMPAMLDTRGALLRSCNGYFLEWAKQAPSLHRFGGWLPVLQAAGLSEAPADIAEAIGLRSTLSISPVGLARAYRALAIARPDVISMLQANAREGTLSGLPASTALEHVALKTGTVRDVQSRPRYGWIVGVTSNLVVVLARSGVMPRSMANELTGKLAKASRLAAQGPVRVQVFGLIDERAVSAQCSGPAITVSNGKPEITHARLPHTQEQQLFCLSGPFTVSSDQFKPEGQRTYAGLFSYSRLSNTAVTADAMTGERALRARRGSSILFETSRALYAAGVLEAEDAQITGHARRALIQVIDSNGQHSQQRHPGRPVCDTTHCQAFRGTAKPSPDDLHALETPYLGKEWLPFSQGGTEPWVERRPLTQLERFFGGARPLIARRADALRVTVSRTDGTNVYEHTSEWNCELVRNTLKLPSCPDDAQLTGEQIVFKGRGRGHGLGLDLEWAKTSGLDAPSLLRKAYEH